MDERELLARLIQCEAGGEGDDGMAAVATVIMNRVRAAEGEFARVSNGGDVRAIILQPGQFTCAMDVLRNGSYNPQNIYNMTPEPIHYAIADRALAGEIFTPAGEALFFFNPYAQTCPQYFPTEVGIFHMRLGEHCFYAPTALYSQT